MYQFIDATWNTVKGSCPHDCSYCYMKRWGKLKEAGFDEKELKTDLGQGNFIFVGSGCDLFAKDIPNEWIYKTLNYCHGFDNKYLFQTKNPKRLREWFEIHGIYEKSIACTTIESDSFYPDFMGNTPHPVERSIEMQKISEHLTTYVTIEPIMDFHLEHFITAIKRCHPEQVNIGADTGHNRLPEPPREKILELIAALEEFTVVKQKSNLSRLLK
ncbi:MAG: phage Gp37/Gp68 family protein [Clostridiales bacterium]|nr:phage Gp37/Gp68 family protein [Clostridiales bacterium]